MALSPSHLLTSQDMEDFAQDYLKLSGTDTDLYYESYYHLNTDEDDVDYVREDEMSQSKWEY